MNASKFLLMNRLIYNYIYIYKIIVDELVHQIEDSNVTYILTDADTLKNVRAAIQLIKTIKVSFLLVFIYLLVVFE